MSMHEPRNNLPKHRYIFDSQAIIIKKLTPTSSLTYTYLNPIYRQQTSQQT
jgi:hypothetical protein